jgi:hypothetical protein
MCKTILAGVLLTMGLIGNAHAADIGSCPEVSDIKSSPYTDPDLPPPHGEGFQYTAPGGWTGQVSSTADDFLDPKYELKAEKISDNGKVCDYGGKDVVIGNEKSTPYLRLKKE